MFSSTHWRGLTQTHFPPQPRKTARHSDITDVTRAANHPAPQRRIYTSALSFPQWQGLTLSTVAMQNLPGTATSQTELGHTVRNRLDTFNI